MTHEEILAQVRADMESESEPAAERREANLADCARLYFESTHYVLVAGIFGAKHGRQGE